MNRLLPPAAALALALGACKASPDAFYDNHWNPGSLGPRVSRVAVGYTPVWDGSPEDYEERTLAHMALTIRRHILIDNPENPFEWFEREGDPDSPYSLWPDWSDFYTIGREAVLDVYYTARIAFWMPIDLVAGTFADAVGLKYDDYAATTMGGTLAPSEGEPPPPSAFRVRHK